MEYILYGLGVITIAMTVFTGALLWAIKSGMDARHDGP